jgi:hypothetical protein
MTMKRSPRIPHLICLGLLGGMAVAVMPGCPVDGPGLPNPLEFCDVGCPDERLAEGNASISGIASVDAFFGAVISLRAAGANANANMRAEMELLAASLEIEGAADLSMDDLAAAIAGELELKFGAYTQGGLSVSFQPPKCEANMEIVAEAAAECDVEATPGEVDVECSGSCEISAEAQAQCSAEGNLSCTGQAPSFDCSGGTCTGSCEADVAFECEGSCQGSCEGTCTVCAGGDCEDDGNGVITNCAGSCVGTCDGTCELEAGGNCGFRCEGSCEYQPGEGVECEAGATASCDVSASAEVECSGKCEGEVTPPEVSAECQASVEAKASAEVECMPPSLSLDFQFKAGLSAEEKAEFKVWLEQFRVRFAAMIAVNAKLEAMAPALGQVVVAGEGAVKGAIQAMLDSGELDFKATLGAGCGLAEADEVGKALESTVASVEGTGSAFVTIAASVGK